MVTSCSYYARLLWELLGLIFASLLTFSREALNQLS